MKLVNSELFLNARNLFLMSIKSIPSIFVKVIFLLAALYASPKSHKSDLSIDVLNLVCLLGLYLSSALPY